MTDLDLRLVFWAVWAVGTFLVYGVTFVRRLSAFRERRDHRARREAFEAFGYFLVAVAASLGITVVLYFRATGWASLLFAISSGVFFVVGLYTVADAEDGRAT